MKLLAVTSTGRLRNYPDTPTVAETVPGFTSSGWSILVAPNGTPAKPSCRRSTPICARRWPRPEVVRKIEELGNYTRPDEPKELADFVREERDIWEPIVKQIGIAQ